MTLDYDKTKQHFNSKEDLDVEGNYESDFDDDDEFEPNLETKDEDYSDFDDEAETDEDYSDFDDETETDEDYDNTADDIVDDNQSIENGLINNPYDSNHYSPKITEVTNIAPINLNDVTLRIACQVGEVNLSIQELQNLSIGSYITIGNLLPTVKLITNGINFAEGLLVDMDGRIGVKVINIIKTGLK